MKPEAQNILFVFLNLHFTPSQQIKVIKLINWNNLKDVLALSMMCFTAFLKPISINRQKCSSNGWEPKVGNKNMLVYGHHYPLCLFSE